MPKGTMPYTTSLIMLSMVSYNFFLYISNILKTYRYRPNYNSTDLSMPSKRCLCFLDMSAPPPQAASTCNQSPYFVQMSANFGIGSKAPRTVVPAVADTMNGFAPSNNDLELETFINNWIQYHWVKCFVITK